MDGTQKGQILVSISPAVKYSSHKNIEEGDAITRRHGSNQKMKEIAEACGISEVITENPGQHSPMPQTLAATVEAVIGAVWFDSERNFKVVQDVMEHLQS
jgi:ribonuclease-3